MGETQIDLGRDEVARPRVGAARGPRRDFLDQRSSFHGLVPSHSDPDTHAAVDRAKDIILYHLMASACQGNSVRERRGVSIMADGASAPDQTFRRDETVGRAITGENAF